MKIGIDARILSSPNLRGMGKYLSYLIKNFKEMGSHHEFILFFDARHNESKHIFESEKIKKKKLCMKGDKLFLWEQLRLPFEIKQAGIDVFHSPANTVSLFQFCPAVVTLHDTLLMESDEDELRNFLFYTRKIIPFGLKKAKKIITISNNSKKDITKYFNIPPEKIEIIYHGIDPVFKKLQSNNIIDEIRKKNGIRNKYIFALGAIGPRKNTNRLIDVFHQLKKELKIEHQLVISGIQGANSSIFEKKIKKLDIKNEIILTNYVTEDELIGLYNGAELFIYPSLYEGFGFPVLEAMACGTPVITSNISSMPELAGDAGILFNPTNNADIARAIIEVIENPTLQRVMSEKGLERVKLFTWRKCAEQTLKVYENLLKEKERDLCQK